MSESSQYIYGVIPAAAQPIVRGAGLKTVAFEDLAAVTRPAAPVLLAGMRKDELARLLVEHQKVIELIMQSAITIIPFRLGTCAASEEEAAEVLARGRKLLRRIFGEINGKIEMDVVASWSDFVAVLRAIGDRAEIKECKAALAARPGGVDLEAQMKIGLMVKEALDAARGELARQITAALSAAAGRQCRHENLDDQMVMNSAFLLEIPQRARFESALDELNARWHNQLNFRCVGPLPPYSFYTVEYKKIRWEEMDWARRRLGLGDSASADEIKKAFQRAALADHPDHGAAAAGDGFLELKRAHGIIREYRRACEQEAPAGRIFFTAEGFRQNAVLVSARSPK